MSNIGTSEKHHELSTWDCKLSTFHSHHKEDVNKMASSYGMTYIITAGWALFNKFNKLREEAKKASTPFNNNPDLWTDAAQATSLKQYFEKPENGKIITQLSILRSAVLKKAFGLAMPPQTIDAETGESETGEHTPTEGPFTDNLKNEIWRVFASQMMENYDQLAYVDMLEPNPANRREAM